MRRNNPRTLMEVFNDSKLKSTELTLEERVCSLEDRVKTMGNAVADIKIALYRLSKVFTSLVEEGKI